MKHVFSIILCISLLFLTACSSDSGQVAMSQSGASSTATSSAVSESAEAVSKAEDYQPAELTVVAFDVNNYLKAGNKDAFIEHLKSLDADIIGLSRNNAFFDEYQTVMTEQSVLDKVYDNSEMGIADSSNYTDLCSICTNGYKLYDVEVITFENQYSENGSYNYIKAYTDIGGRKVCLITCYMYEHRDFEYYVRWAQYQELMDAVKNEEFFIAMGGFNSYSGLNELKLFAEAGMNIANFGDNTFPTTVGMRPMGNIITSGNITVTQAHCVTDMPGNCYPVVATLTFN